MAFQPFTSRFVALGLVTACASGCSDDSPENTRQQALAYATDDIACTNADECCAVLDGCMAQMLIVGARDKAKVEELIAAAPDDPCVACISPVVQVDCVQGLCTGVELEPIDGASWDPYPSELARTHCGKLTPPPGWQEAPAAASLAAPPGLSPRKVLGCN